MRKRLYMVGGIAIVLAAYALYVSNSSNPLAVLDALNSSREVTGYVVTADGTWYEYHNLYFSGSHALAARRALSGELRKHPWRLRLEGSNYDFYTCADKAGVHDVSYLLTAINEPLAVVHESKRVSPIHTALLKLVGKVPLAQSPSSIDLPNGVSELNAAAGRGDISSVRLAVSKGASIRTVGDAPSPLYFALLNGHVEVAKYLLRNGGQINDQVPPYGNILEALANSGRPEVVEFAFSQGAHFSDKGQRALINCARQLSPVDKVVPSVWMEVSVTPSNADFADGSWIDDRSWKQSPDVAKVYVAHGADVNEKLFPEGYSPLSEAATMGNEPLVKLLLEEGADPRQALTGRPPYKLNFRNDWAKVRELLQVALNQQNPTKNKW